VEEEEEAANFSETLKQTHCTTTHLKNVKDRHLNTTRRKNQKIYQTANNFHVNFFRKYVDEIQVSFKFYKNKEYFTGRPACILIVSL
jgi:hypothetical protein